MISLRTTLFWIGVGSVLGGGFCQVGVTWYSSRFSLCWKCLRLIMAIQLFSCTGSWSLCYSMWCRVWKWTNGIFINLPAGCNDFVLPYCQCPIKAAATIDNCSCHIARRGKYFWPYFTLHSTSPVNIFDLAVCFISSSSISNNTESFPSVIYSVSCAKVSP